jgi:uncharacterized membrane protein
MSRQKYEKKPPRAFLPDPAFLQEYEYATEGAADRILAMAEREQTARLASERRAFVFYRRSYRTGQWCGVLCILAVILACVYLAMQGLRTEDQSLRENMLSMASFLAVGGFSAVAAANGFAYLTLRAMMGIRDIPAASPASAPARQEKPDSPRSERREEKRPLPSSAPEEAQASKRTPRQGGGRQKQRRRK